MTTYKDKFRDTENIMPQDVYLITDEDDLSCIVSTPQRVIGVTTDEDEAMCYEKKGCYVWLIEAKLMERKSTEEW